MIQTDASGQRFVQMADGTRVPLAQASITVTLQSPFDGQIGSAVDVLAELTTAAQYWYQKSQRQDTIIADLREQLAK